MKIQTAIETKITNDMTPEHLDVVNESHMHNVAPGSESHFKLTIVSTAFAGKMLVARHRLVNKLLQEELDGPVHALSMHTYTPQEWLQKNSDVRSSPPCLGGAKREQND